jgi:hypothetical protein
VLKPYGDFLKVKGAVKGFRVSSITYSTPRRPRSGRFSHNICIRIGNRLCQDARLENGDRLEFLFDLENGTGRIEKVEDGVARGRKLLKSGQNSKQIRMPWVEASHLPLVKGPELMENVNVVDDGAIEFRFPATLMSQEEVARNQTH